MLMKFSRELDQVQGQGEEHSELSEQKMVHEKHRQQLPAKNVTNEKERNKCLPSIDSLIFELGDEKYRPIGR
jgi:hypothetical protein